MKKIEIIVERGKGKHNFSCFATSDVNNCVIGGYGASAREAMQDCYASIQDYKSMAAEKGETFPDVELEFRFDVGAFFDYYPIDVTAFAKYIGMNASVLRQYVTALREPKQGALKKIREGVESFSRDLGRSMMIERPVLSYVA